MRKYLSNVHKSGGEHPKRGGGGKGIIDFFLTHRLGPSICLIPPKISDLKGYPPPPKKKIKKKILGILCIPKKTI